MKGVTEAQADVGSDAGLEAGSRRLSASKLGRGGLLLPLPLDDRVQYISNVRELLRVSSIIRRRGRRMLILALALALSKGHKTTGMVYPWCG